MTSAEQILVIREAAYAARAVLDNATWVARDGSPAMAYRKDLHPRFRDAIMGLEALLCHPPEEPAGRLDIATDICLAAIAEATGLPADVIASDLGAEGALTRAQYRARRTGERTTRWLSRLDKHTCDACRARHGEPAGTGVTRHKPPPHPDCESEHGCRCTLEAEGWT